MNAIEANKQALAVLAASILIFANALLHARDYGNRNYREDEVRVVHESMLFSTTEFVNRLATENIHPPGWRLLAKFWIAAFGPSEEITRWLAKIINLITFALLYQLGKHIGGRRAGLYAVVLLGAYGFASNLMYELRPYPMLIMLTTALHLLFFRWIQKPSSALMFAYVFAGIAAIYTHFFTLFVFPAHAVILALFRRCKRKLWLDSLLMWLFIGLSFTGWLLPFLHSITVRSPGGIPYSLIASGATIREFYDGSKFEPEIVFQWLMLLSPFALLRARRGSAVDINYRFQGRHLGVFPLILLVSIFLIALAGDAVVGSLSLRNVVMLAPLIAVCMALGLRLVPTKAALCLASLLLVHAPHNIAWQTSNAPYREFVRKMSYTYQSDSIVVTEFKRAWTWLLPVAYYLMEFTPDRMSKDRMFHVVEPYYGPAPGTVSDPLINIHNGFDAHRFERELPSHRQLWRLSEGGGNAPGIQLQHWLSQNYALVQTHTWDEPYFTSYALSEYAKAPDHQGPLIQVGDAMRLYSWQLEGSVETAACQSVTVESWWQSFAEMKHAYSLSIILATEDGDRQIEIQNSVPANVFTTEWQPNRFYRDHTKLEIPCVLEAGRYILLLAAKETVSGNALRILYPDGRDIGSEFYLTTIHVMES